MSGLGETGGMEPIFRRNDDFDLLFKKSAQFCTPLKILTPDRNHITMDLNHSHFCFVLGKTQTNWHFLCNENTQQAKDGH